LTQWMEYNFGKNFFENFQLLYLKLPFAALYNYAGAENSGYAFSVLNSKNCYLSFTVISDCENILYSFAVKENCKNVLNSSQVWNNCENIYQCLGVINSYNIFYSRFIDNCADVWFSTNLVGCKHCIGCNGLENKSYCIRNQQLNKEEYEEQKKTILVQKERYMEFFGQISSDGKNFGSQNVTGKFVLKSYDVDDGYCSLEIKDGKNLLVVGGSNLNEHMYDVFEAGAHGNTNFFGAMNAGVKSENIYNCEGIVTCNNVYYSRFLEHCNYCIGCIGLKNKEFCILNEQYSKEEWFELADKVFAQMDSDGILGKYFPAKLNPFYFNDTVASLVGDFKKDEIVNEWFLWRDEEIKVDIPEWLGIVKASDLDVVSFDESILKKVIQDEKGNFYRIVPMELEFLKKYGLPLPTVHWLDRIKLGFRFKF